MSEHIPYPDMVPHLGNDQVTLRAIGLADVPAITEQCADPVMLAWTPVPAPPYSDRDAEGFIAAVRDEAIEGSALTWALDVGGRYAGNISLRHQRFDSAEIGFATHPAYRGRGLMTSAVQVVVDYAFSIGVHVLVWKAGFGNWASRRVAWACGFQFDGINRNGWSNGRRRADEWHATLLATDPRTPKAPWLVPPTIQGERVVLRDQRDSDAARIAEACQDKRTRHWLSALPENYGLSDAETFIAMWRDHHSRGVQLNFGLADPSTGDHIGALSLMGTNIMAGQAEVGYWLHPDARGRGVMTEAVGLAVRHAFSPPAEGGLGLRRLVLRAAEGNAASRHVAESDGFLLVGRERQGETLGDGSVVDLLYYDLLVPSEDLVPAPHPSEEHP